MLEEVEGIEKLELLQTHKNEEVYKKVVHILKTYFPCEDT